VSDPILVSIVIQSPPKAEDDQVSTPMDESVNINLISKNKDNDGTIIKAKIVVDPKFGKLSLPDALGNVIYTPDPSFVGSDTFQYTVQDNDGLISSPGTVTINVTSVPKIGLSKALTSVRNSINGSFVVRFNFTIGNYGKELLEKISLKDNLALSFAGTQVKVLAINPTGTLKANSNYNGVGDIEMLSPTSTLATGKIETVELILSIMLSDAEGFFQNTAIVEGYSVLSGTKTDDASVSGVRPDPFTPGNVTPLGPTVVELKKGPLYIPEGFSPNNDGINDVFIVSNSQGKKIHLDVYNRWGNRVYKSSSYQNDWDGRCSEGIYLGQDLPAGTYYYIVIIDDKEKFMGYITINR
jgi:gliding motility-associated-like protein